MYLSKQSRPEIQLSVSYLFTRIIEPYTNYYKKLARVMQHIPGTICLPLILSIKNYVNIKWYVDVAFAVHNDRRRHTGGFMTIGTGGYYVKSSFKNIPPRVQMRTRFLEWIMS